MIVEIGIKFLEYEFTRINFDWTFGMSEVARIQRWSDNFGLSADTSQERSQRNEIFFAMSKRVIKCNSITVAYTRRFIWSRIKNEIHRKSAQQHFGIKIQQNIQHYTSKLLIISTFL